MSEDIHFRIDAEMKDHILIRCRNTKRKVSEFMIEAVMKELRYGKKNLTPEEKLAIEKIEADLEFKRSVNHNKTPNWRSYWIENTINNMMVSVKKSYENGTPIQHEGIIVRLKNSLGPIETMSDGEKELFKPGIDLIKQLIDDRQFMDGYIEQAIPEWNQWQRATHARVGAYIKNYHLKNITPGGEKKSLTQPKEKYIKKLKNSQKKKK